MRFFIWFGYCLIVCNTTILIKFGRLALHYRNRMENDDEDFISPEDPFEHFGLQSRQLICDAAINAKQFMFKYGRGHEKTRKDTITKLTIWNSLAVLRKSTKYNYQRVIGDRSNKDPDPEYLQYRPHATKFGSYMRRQIKSFQCVNEKKIKWFITFGLVDKYMYLLQPGLMKSIKPDLLVTGIFDPKAIIDDRPAHYFYNQFRSSKRTLESIVCEMGADDRLRLCSAILVLLSPIDSVPNRNYFMKQRQACLKKDIKIEDKIFNARFLRCTFFQENRSSTPFHILGDANERGAVFVFVIGEGRELELYRRVNKVSSLINPVGQMKKGPLKRRASTKHSEKQGQLPEILLPELWGQKAKRGSGRPMIEFNEQDTTTSEEGE